MAAADTEGFRPAGFWLRVWAKFADLMVTNICQLMLLILVPVLHTLGVPGGWTVWAFGAMVLSWFAYFTIFSSGGRQTFGYRLAGMKVTVTDGSATSGGRSLVRTVLDTVFLGLVSYGIGLVGYLPVAIGRSKRGLHDILTGTKVTRCAEAKKGLLAVCAIASIAVPAVAVFLIIRPLFVQAFYLPAESMQPTVAAHERVLVDKLYYRVHAPKPGEIVLFSYPTAASALIPSAYQVYIKRVVGVAGDRISVKNGGLYRNGRHVAEPYLAEPRILYDMDEITVPRGKLFVLGDNRNNSNDSHVWGSLDERNLIGKAMFVYPRLRGL